jgi:short-subunit dehydrogenase
MLSGRGRGSPWPPEHTLITGAGGALGTALAARIAAAGGALSLCDLAPEGLRAAAARCSRQGGAVTAELIDVRNGPALRDWIDARDTARPLECVIANAGISLERPQGAVGEALDSALEIIQVNLIGVLNTVYPAIERMSERGRGRIVLIASLASLAGFPRVPVYAATKAAVRVFGQSIHPTLRRRGIELLIACPGFFQSRMTFVDRPVPLGMSADEVAARIETALRRGRTRVSFPAPLVAMISLLRVLPYHLRARIYERWLDPEAGDRGLASGTAGPRGPVSEGSSPLRPGASQELVKRPLLDQQSQDRSCIDPLGSLLPRPRAFRSTLQQRGRQPCRSRPRRIN